MIKTKPVIMDNRPLIIFDAIQLPCQRRYEACISDNKGVEWGILITGYKNIELPAILQRSQPLTDVFNLSYLSAGYKSLSMGRDSV
jgi:hypothetical protein